MHRRFTMKDGLPSNKVYSVTQDSKGFIWFGTDAGACRFDGRVFTNYSVPEGLADNEVLNIAEDSQGRVWFLTLNGRLSYYKDGAVVNERSEPGLHMPYSTSGWQSFCEDRNGGLWIGGVYGGLLKLTPEGMVDTLFLPDFGIISVVHDERDSLMVFQSGRVYQVREGRPVFMYEEVRLFRSIIVPDRLRNTGGPLVLFEQGVMSYGVQGPQLLVPSQGELDVLVHRRAWRDQEGGVWVQRRMGGIDMYRSRDGGFGPRINLMSRDRVNHCLVDEDGVRWLATDKGVVRMSRSQLGADLFLLPHGEEAVMSLCVSRSGSIWAGGDRGGFYCLKDGRLEQVELRSDRLGLGRLLRIVEDEKGVVWIASDFSLSVYGPEKEEHRAIPFDHAYHGLRPFHREAARTVLLSADGRVLVGGNGLQVLVRTDTGSVRRFLDPDNIPYIRVYALHEDPQGRIWFEQNEVLKVLDRDVVKEVPLGRFSGGKINDITSYSPDTLLVATSTSGLLMLAGGEVVMSAGPRTGFPVTVIKRVRVHQDTIWTAGPDGVYAFVLSGQELRLCSSITEDQDGSSVDAQDVVVVENDIVIATAKGLLRIPKAALNELRKEPVPYIHEVQLNDSTIEMGGTVRMDARSGVLRVLVRAISFSTVGTIQYQYRVGPDGNWTSMPEGRADISNMLSGYYRVEVRARLGGGPWTRPIGLDLEVISPWYRTGWAYLIWAAMVVGLVWMVSVSVMRLRHARVLQRMQARQLLQEERRRIAADMHDDLGADLSLLWGQARSLQAGEGDAGQLAEGIGKSMERIDDIIWSLDPERDNVRSTADFIEGWVRNYTHANGLSFRSRIHVPTAACALPTQQRRELALVVKEALRNIVKHADAGTVQLGIRLDAGIMQVMVQDDGRHSPLNQNSGRRSGSANMERRMERIGGRMRWEGVAPQGTRLVLEMDLDPSEWVM